MVNQCKPIIFTIPKINIHGVNYPQLVGLWQWVYSYHIINTYYIIGEHF